MSRPDLYAAVRDILDPEGHRIMHEVKAEVFALAASRGFRRKDLAKLNTALGRMDEAVATAYGLHTQIVNLIELVANTPDTCPDCGDFLRRERRDHDSEGIFSGRYVPVCPSAAEGCRTGLLLEVARESS